MTRLKASYEILGGNEALLVSSILQVLFPGPVTSGMAPASVTHAEDSFGLRVEPLTH